MAKIIVANKEGEKEAEVTDNSPFQTEAEQLGIVFGCRDGMCATCMVEVLEGQENLKDKTDAEDYLCQEPNTRLCCQAEIKEGTVKMRVFG
jgi:ferredoxin